jgi:uncharacterized ferritin-like protein (DUF455 family)
VVSRSLFAAARGCLAARDPVDKLLATEEAAAAWRRTELDWRDPAGIPAPATPGRLQRPHLVPPRQLPARHPGTALGRAALIHALAHIELNAVDLAWDAVCRFRHMPLEYYQDWVQVAEDEARHFSMLVRHLERQGYRYGDFDAHNGLWEMAQKTSEDVMVRMALVPRMLEARGLDVVPGIIERLERAGDRDGAAILRTIQQDEVAHVAAGSRWFRYCCRERGLDPGSTFLGLVHRHLRGPVKGPLHREARLRAGFTPAELAALEDCVLAGCPKGGS